MAVQNSRHGEQITSFPSLSRIDVIAFFTAFALFLSSIEYLLPRPVPFFRYGLANIAILLAIRTFTFRDVFLLGTLKVLGLGILNGTFASYVFVFSLFGTMGAFVTMFIAERMLKTRISLIGIGVLGSLVSNLIQILCAILYVFGVQSWFIAPYLLLLGTISGAVVGILAQYYWNHSSVLQRVLDNYYKNH